MYIWFTYREKVYLLFHDVFRFQSLLSGYDDSTTFSACAEPNIGSKLFSCLFSITVLLKFRDIFLLKLCIERHSFSFLCCISIFNFNGSTKRTTTT